MTTYYVIYNKEVAIWVYEEEYKEKIKNGFKLFARAYTEEEANKLTEKACYIR